MKEMNKEFHSEKIDMKEQETIFRKMLEENHKALEHNKKFEPQYKTNMQRIITQAREVG